MADVRSRPGQVPATGRAASGGTRRPGSLSHWAVARRVWRVLALFFGILAELGWAGYTQRLRVYGHSPQYWEALYRRQAVRFRRTSEELGGLLIKVGQFLSSRVDLLPQAFIEELETLQDRVQAAPWEAVRPILEAEIPDFEERFAGFDPEPLAAASLGQVYRARLADGTPVAVKVQRPDIEDIVTADLRALRLVVLFTTRFTRFGRTFDLLTVYREFRRTVYEELDYRAELANADFFARALADIPWLHVPATYPRYSTGRVLTMAYWEGIKVNHRRSLLAAGIDPSLVAERLIDVYLRMVMEMGVFHADPHPGNILVQPGGDIVLLDYGMVGRLDIATRRQMRRLFVAVAERRASELVDSLWALGMVLPHADRAALKEKVRYLLDRYYAETLAQVLDLDVVALLRDFENLLRDDAIQIPGTFAFLGRAIAILVGLATRLDPDINLVQLFAPYAQRFVAEDQGGTVAMIRERLTRLGRQTLEIPDHLQRVLRQIEDGEVQTRLRWNEGTDHLNQLVRALRGLTHAIYVMGFALAGTVLWVHHLDGPALAALALTLLAALMALQNRHRG
ncbi:ABC transporter [Candidatus Hydrogenisulfobacillus filiaventi]|uniref:ABC transporter n=1 Tax=Candidatus Hydrogenisulfobacillus filiaventi TaxID=2707344 RepID=A0A6F8ZHA2_9FIRM|nr:ABC transporter [Candidatus Hydrogenisulfobacillus filiaventi]